MEKRHTKLIILMTLILFITFNILLVLYSFTQSGLINVNTFASREVANVNFCLDKLIQLNNINESCSANYSLHTNETFTCNLNYTQLNNDTLNFSSYFDTETEIFTIQSNGTINYTSTNETWGTHNAVIVVTEESDTCNNNSQISSYEYNFIVTLNNTAPEYYTHLPNITMVEYSRKIPYYLNDYFRDIDGHQLTYTFLSQAPNYYNISINQDTGEVTIISYGECGEFPIGFMVEDPEDEYAISSPFPKLTITCSDSSGGSTGGSSGGSSGGGSSRSSTCNEDWTCQGWSDCYSPTILRPENINGYQKRTCYDQEGCDADNYEYTLYQDCFYEIEGACYPSWECGEWTPCRDDGTQERICLDENSCNEGEQKRFGIPTLIKLCAYLESCTDGVKNGNELGVDCGGSCEPCKTIELAAIIQDSNKILTWVIGSLIFILLAIIILYKIFKKQIKELFSKLAWNIVKKHARQIYLLGNNKKNFISELKSYENKLVKISKDGKIDKKEKDKLDSDFFILFRKLFSEILEINYDSSKELFMKKIIALETTEEFRKILLNLTNRFLIFESDGRKGIVTINDIILDYNIIKFIAITVSDSLKTELKQINLVSLKQDELMEMITLINKSYILLQRNNSKESKEIYLKIIKKYENLNEKDKSKIYDLTTILFNILTYVSSHIENK
jgi:hypothetical protein